MHLLLLLSLLVTIVLLVAVSWLLPALPAGEGIYVSAAVTVLLGGLMIGSYAHFLNLASWERLRPARTHLPRRTVVLLVLVLLGSLALLWPSLKPAEPVAADAGWYLHFDAPEAGTQADAEDGGSEIRVKFTSGRQ